VTDFLNTCRVELHKVTTSQITSVAGKNHRMSGDSFVGPQWACPEHGLLLEQAGESLICAQGHEYPIIDGIPRFVPHSDYTAAFGAQWKRYRLTQLDSYTGTTITSDRTRRCLGESLWGDLDGKSVLECGSGAGRFTEILTGLRARLTSVDMSDAVSALQESFPQSDTLRIGQADILRLPFEPKQYDVVFCLGVIQHTPDPETTIERLFDQVKPGGTLVIDHYKPRLLWWFRLAPYIRMVLKRLPPERGMVVSEWFVRTFLPLHRKYRKITLLRILLNRISPVFYYFDDFPELSDQLHYEWALVDTHDAMTDWYKFRRTPEQIRRHLERIGAVDIEVWTGGNGVEARADRAVG
jgi:2-polyprenyl-3-methyl-5-hydroxy-6-metoxy-1,4-benzoquinol methylase